MESKLSKDAIVRELRQPLTSVLAAVHLAEGCDEDDAPNAKLAQLRSYGRQLATALADIDGLEQLLQGHVAVEALTYDLPELLDACVRDIAPLTALREVEIKLDVSPKVPTWVTGDEARLRQLFDRLLQLATVRCTIGPIDIFASMQGRTLQLRLLNRHAGLEDPDGLGVMFARELAEALGGKLTLKERKGGGSEYGLDLPLQFAEDWESELAAADDQNRQTHSIEDCRIRGHVLLITDNHDHQHLLTQIMSQRGATVMTAENREMALHLLDAASYQMILLDMQADNDAGIETAALIRFRGANCPMLAISSDETPEALESYLAAGCNGTLPKPIDVELLHGALAMHLAAAR